MYFRQIQKQYMIFSYPRIVLTVILQLFVFFCVAQKHPHPIERVDPPNWWTDMQHSTIELIFKGKNIQQYMVSLDAENTTIKQITLPSNKEYMIVEIEIDDDQQADTLQFVFSAKKKKSFQYPFPILLGKTYSPKGINGNDLIYLIFPDRFANGDTSNDIVPGMNETTLNRADGYARHGGDIQGILHHLDYLQDLGIKSIWVTPLIENNQPKTSYHGYAATDNYKIDPRFGTNELYKKLSEECHKRGIKLIADMVYNHWGNEHYLFKEMPDSSWFHWFPSYTKTSYRAEVLLDPYASQSDKTTMSNGWFDKHMPDLNQQNPHLAKYLIQNSIWWIEYANIDAFRIDTYAYPDQQFMKQLNEAILLEYPDFISFGETWVQGSPVQAYFTGDNNLNDHFSSSLQSVTDFQLYYAITKGLTEPSGWEEGLRRIQMTLAHDVLYKDPFRLVTFLDNHDLSRFYSMVEEDLDKFKMGIALIYTLRGIPCVYYGTEVLMKNYCDPDSKVREDFKGGWTNDIENKFSQEGRTAQENEAFNFMRTLGQWRKTNEWIGQSKLTQFVPFNDTYVYFRRDDNHTLMCIYNMSKEALSLDLSRFSECIQGKPSGLNIITQQRLAIGDSMVLSPNSVTMIQLF